MDQKLCKMTVEQIEGLALLGLDAQERATKHAPDLVIIEIPLPDGWMSMFAGRLVRRDEKEIVITDAAWVSQTGRRHLFFAGTPDANCEIETYPNGCEICLPAAGAVVTQWPHAPLREVR